MSSIEQKSSQTRSPHVALADVAVPESLVPGGAAQIIGASPFHLRQGVVVWIAHPFLLLHPVIENLVWTADLHSNLFCAREVW